MQNEYFLLEKYAISGTPSFFQLQLQSELQHRTQLENQKLGLQTRNHEYESEIRSAQKQVQPIKEKLKECKEEKRELEDAREVCEDEIRSTLERIRANGDELRKKIVLIKRYDHVSTRYSCMIGHGSHCFSEFGKSFSFQSVVTLTPTGL